MSIVSLLLGQPARGTRITRELTSAGISAAILLDATLKEDFTADSELTQHPVEKSADISDHIIIKPEMLTIAGKITETPFSINGQLAGIASTVASQVGIGLGGALGGVAATAIAAKTLAGVLAPPSVTGAKVIDNEQGRSALGLPSGENVRLRDAVSEFMNIRKAKTPVTIVTGLRVYENYVLTGCSFGRDAAGGQAIMVNLKFQQLILSTTSEVVVNIPGIKNALGKTGLGSKAASASKDAGGTTVAFDIMTSIYGGK